MSETRIWDGVYEEQDKMSHGASMVRSLSTVTRQQNNVGQTSNIILIDISGSTKEPTSENDPTDKLTREKEVATMFVSKLPKEACFSLISFDDPANIEIPLQTLTQKLAAIQPIQSLRCYGGTGMKSALKLALNELEKSPAGYFKRVYCITDGMGTDGDCTAIAEKLKAAGVQLHFIGFGSGNEIDESTMRNLASESESKGTLYMHFTEFSQLSQYMGTETQNITD